MNIMNWLLIFLLKIGRASNNRVEGTNMDQTEQMTRPHPS
jgi:hypothetical protein